MFDKKHSISLLFNASKTFDRKVIAGIGQYLQSTKINWDVFLEEDFMCRISQITDWAGDGIIADFDDPEIRAAVENLNIPVVGVGSSFTNEAQYPQTAYVATDNDQIMLDAYEHLKSKGLERFAFYGLPQTEKKPWAEAREQAFKRLIEIDGYDSHIYQGQATQAYTWKYSMNQLTDWLENLPKPIGIIAVTDSRARQLLQACEHSGILVPDRVSIIGIDDDEIVRDLCRVSLSSIIQGCEEMGCQAAKQLDKLLDDAELPAKRIMVKPQGVSERNSTDYKALADPYVMQALHFVRQYASRGIKVEQVVDYVGISRSNLEQRFKDECGHSLHTEIHNVKLEKACKMLKSSDLPTSHIAEICGYPSLQYMYTVFKKHFNKTPREYRVDMIDDESLLGSY